MKSHVSKTEVKKLIGKNIVATRKNGSFVTGKLVRISGNRLILQRNVGKKVQTKAIIPLVLFDLLAIGTAPYAGYGYGTPYAGPVGAPGVGPGYGYGGYNPFFF
ncbi:hypothetical protein [Paenibacillus sp. IHBB 10380]|uniref:hypothetical protein n=1 Tax=Paenibacillus sp. IHBB 10380 TaxID=1566358 RepID=UPI0005CF9718|nr:hypothetical protein [Paenibacillus sp. IHBB 10380]AJS59711.1 hypothetical protein UB51_15865 [Paenibacillus sp. IHBB 10380]